MTFNADLHVHSRYSRATSRDMDLERLYIAAQIKGISLVGTGDFTHPQWCEELQKKLVMDENGLLRLRPDIAAACDRNVPGPCRHPVRFALQAEISNIYKKNGKTRKNHNLVYLPDFDSVERFNRTLERLGNIHSDGRPILGLDARNLLELVIETSERGMLIPAHVWTPWFSLLGSKSGFDTIRDCFDDLSDYIVAIETGLSSDPPMNWRVSDLDGLTLVSNSDAHSPGKIGREATVFNCDLSYDRVFDAIRSGDPERFVGTLEFYPEEGKYHLDGHRKCRVRMTPQESISRGNMCPVCGKELTLGVLHRVMALSNRAPGGRPEKTHSFKNMVSLPHILGEIFTVGSETRTVQRHYHNIVSKLGSELSVLLELPEDIVGNVGVPLLGEAVSRVRQGSVHIAGGYDGVFGTISIFTDDERAQLTGQRRLFPVTAIETSIPPGVNSAASPDIQTTLPVSKDAVIAKAASPKVNDAQQAAIEHGAGPLVIVAGPGTGKTLTLTHRVAHLVNQSGVSPERILAVTFTHKAAEEMKRRLEILLPVSDRVKRPIVSTFHAFCHFILQEDAIKPFSIIAEEDRVSLVSAALSLSAADAPEKHSAAQILSLIIQAKQRHLDSGDDLSDMITPSMRGPFTQIYARYQELLELQRLVDFEDLIRLMVVRLETDSAFRQRMRARFTHVLVDEYQDINHGQYRLVRALCPPRSTICVIGDPDQSIYGFRGASHTYFNRFTDDYPDAAVVRLTQNYRSTASILQSAYQVVEKQRTDGNRVPVLVTRPGERPVIVVETESDRSEAVAIGKTIEQLVGGTGFQAVDFGVLDDGGSQESLGFSDIAVLMRTHHQAMVIEEILEGAGIPCRRASRSRLMDNRVMTQVISLLRLVAGRGGVADLERVMSVIEPGISPSTLRAVSAWCFQNALPVSALRYSVRQYPVDGLTPKRQQRLYDFLGVPSRMQQETTGHSVVDTIAHIVANSRLKRAIRDNPASASVFEDLLQTAAEHGTDIDAFIAAVMLHSDTDQYSSKAEKVSLMTIHAAKGLEFPVVFIAGCDDGILPFNPSGGDGLDMDEERRLFFVAATRARDQLYLCSARQRQRHGKRVDCAPSPFLGDIENRLKSVVQWHKAPSPDPVPRQLSLF